MNQLNTTCSDLYHPHILFIDTSVFLNPKFTTKYLSDYCEIHIPHVVYRELKLISKGQYSKSTERTKAMRAILALQVIDYRISKSCIRKQHWSLSTLPCMERDLPQQFKPHIHKLVRSILSEADKSILCEAINTKQADPRSNEKIFALVTQDKMLRRAAISNSYRSFTNLWGDKFRQSIKMKKAP